MTSPATITPMERTLLEAIFHSDFHDDRPEDARFGSESAVWSDCVCDAAGLGASAGGVMASLTKKGLAGVQDNGGGEVVVWLTEAGHALVVKGQAFCQDVTFYGNPCDEYAGHTGACGSHLDGQATPQADTTTTPTVRFLTQDDDPGIAEDWLRSDVFFPGATEPVFVHPTDPAMRFLVGTLTTAEQVERRRAFMAGNPEHADLWDEQSLRPGYSACFGRTRCSSDI